MLLVTLWCYNMILLRKRYPPGPFPLPLIGNLHLLRKDIHLSMDKLSRTYGDMFTLWMANIPYVVITDSELARKVCLTTKFADRLPLYVGEQVYTRGAKDMIMADFTPPLKIHRKLARNAFELFGENFYKLESKVLYNVEKLVTKLSAFNENDNVNVCSEIYLSCFNVIWSFVFGDNMSVKEEWYEKIKSTITMMTQSGVVFSFVNFYPILRYLPNPELSEMNSIIEERDVVLEKVINMAEKAYLEKKNKSTTIKTYTEALLKAKNEYEKDDKNAEDVYSRDHLEMNVFDMFLGGVESTNTSFQWTIMYLVKWPHIQLKCHEEIDAVMAEDCARLVQLKHKQRMPYVQAVILESLRMASPFPFGVFHKARVTAELNGYTIEKGIFFISLENLNFHNFSNNTTCFLKNLGKQNFLSTEYCLEEEGKMIGKLDTIRK